MDLAKQPQSEKNPDFVRYRNIYYAVYSGLFLITGLSIAATNKGTKTQIPSAKSGTYSLVPVLILGIIITTFGYAIAGFAVDFFIIIQRIISL